MQNFGSAREVSLARNIDEVVEMPELFIIPPRYPADKFGLGPTDQEEGEIVAAKEVNLAGIG